MFVFEVLRSCITSELSPVSVSHQLTMVILDGILNETQPSDYDYDYKYKDEDVDKAVWIPILYSILVIVGLLGNGLLLAVLAQKRRPWRISDSFILQLGVVDILLLLTLPLYAAHATQSCGWCSQTVLRVCGTFFKVGFVLKSDSESERDFCGNNLASTAVYILFTV